MHLFGKNTILCKCPLNGDSSEQEHPPMTVHVNYITQKGKANIAGDGSIEYKTMQDKLNQVERLQAENKMLSDMLETLRNRDKYVAKKPIKNARF